MNKLILIAVGLTLSFTLTFSQSNPLDKKMEKAYALSDKNKFEEADKYVEKLLEDNPDYGTGWDYLAKVRYQEYLDSKKTDMILGGNMTMTTKGKDGKDVPADDSLSKKLMAMLNSFKPSELAYDKYIYTMRKALLTATDAYYCSQSLRIHFVDEPTDTNVNKKALRSFNDAETEFGKKNYNSAAKLYKRAIEQQPDFFKAALYLGDCFYFTGNYDEAVTSFKQAVATFPSALEPRKYLIDAYAKDHQYDKALEDIIKAMTVYPDEAIAFAKMDDATYLNEKVLAIKWTPRAVLPNKIPSEKEKLNMNVYRPKEEEKVKDPWTFYQKAMSTISANCDEKGIIIKASDLTRSSYMEVYSWEEMLKNSKDASLDEARRMQTAGYLDCYVLVSCFHFDLYDQYKDFATKNRQRIIDYYNKYIVAK